MEFVSRVKKTTISVESILNKDKDALSQLWRKGSEWSRNKNPDRLVKPEFEETLKDLLQESLADLWMVLRKGTQLTMGPEAYFLGILKNRWREVWRNQKKVTLVPVETVAEKAPPDESEERAFLQERYAQLMRLFAKMRQTKRADCVLLFENTWLKGMDTEELALLMQVSQEYIKVKRSRCMKYIREQLNQG